MVRRRCPDEPSKLGAAGETNRSRPRLAQAGATFPDQVAVSGHWLQQENT